MVKHQCRAHQTSVAYVCICDGTDSDFFNYVYEIISKQCSSDIHLEINDQCISEKWAKLLMRRKQQQREAKETKELVWT